MYHHYTITCFSIGGLIQTEFDIVCDTKWPTGLIAEYMAVDPSLDMCSTTTFPKSSLTRVAMLIDQTITHCIQAGLIH